MEPKKRYEVRITEITPYTGDEMALGGGMNAGMRNNGIGHEPYSDRGNHFTRVMTLDLSADEYEAFKRSALENFGK